MEMWLVPMLDAVGRRRAGASCCIGGSPGLAVPMRLSRIDQRGAAPEIAGVDQALDRHAHEGRIGRDRASRSAIGEPPRLGEPVRRPRGPGFRRRHVDGVSSMPSICSTATPPELGGPMPQIAIGPVGAADGLALLDLIGGEVGQRSCRPDCVGCAVTVATMSSAICPA